MSTRKKSRTRFSDEVVDLRSRLAELDQIQGVTHGAPTALPAREDLHYQAIRENIGEMVYRIDYDRGRFNGKLTFISPQVKSLTGYSAREFRNNRNLWLDSIHPDDLERFKSVSETIWASRESGVREYRFLHGKSKSYRWFDDTMVPEFDDSGQLVGSLGVIRDSTDRRSAEHTREIISDAAERIGDTILITNRQGTMEYVNEALVRLSGYEREELLGRTPRIFKSGEHKPTFYKDFWNCILAGQTFNGTFINANKNGRLFYLETTVTPVIDLQGEIASFVATGTDITAEREAASELLAKDIRFQTVWNSTAEGLRLTDGNGVIIDVNASYCRLAGAAADDLIGKPFTQVYRKESTAEWTLDEYRRLFSKGRPIEEYERELTFLQDRTVVVKVTPTFVDIPERPRLMLTVFQDLFRQRDLEQTLRISQETKAASQRLAGLGYWECDPDGGQMQWSDKLFGMLGLTPGEHVPSMEAFLERVHPDDLKSVEAAFKKARKGESFEREYRFLRPDGSERLAQIRGDLTSADSAASRIIGTLEDITEQRRQEDTWRRYEAIINSSAEIMGLVNRDYIIEAANAAWGRMLDQPPESVTGRTLQAIFGETTFTDELKPHLDEAFAGQEIQTDYWSDFGQRGRRCLHFTYQPHRDSANAISKVIMSVRDVTDSVAAKEALIRSEATFAGIVDSAAEAIISLDADRNIIQFNRGAEQIFGYSAEEILGQPLNTLMPERFHAHHDSFWAEFATGPGKSQLMNEAELVLAKRKNGEELPVEASVSRVELSDRTVFSVVLRDITERQKAEEALYESQQKMAYHVDHSPVAFIEWDQRWRVTDWSPAAEQIFGYDKQSALGKNAIDLIIPPGALDRPKQLRRLLEKQKAGLHQVEENVDQAGSTLRCEWFYTPRYADGGQLAGIASLVQDVTARWETEEAQTAELDKLAGTLGSIATAVIATDLAGKIILVNRAAEKLLDQAEKTVMGKPLADVFPLTNAGNSREYALPGPREHKPHQTFVFAQGTVLQTDKGNRLYVAGQANVITGASGKSVGMVVDFHDSTAEELLEAEGLRAKKLESLGTLSIGLALDFNNYLSAIALNIASLGMKSADEPQLTELLQDTEKSTRSARGITEQLATFNRGGVLTKANRQLAPILKETVQFALRGSDVRAEFQLDEEAWPVAVDVALIGQVIHHLARNAVQAMELGGALRITLSNARATRKEPIGPLKAGKYVAVSLRDEGGGIPAMIEDRIYDPFFTTRDDAPGLGLYVAHNIIEQHDGWITQSAAEGQGTEFTFYLPAASNVIVTPPDEKRDLVSGSGRVLIVEPDEMIRSAARRLLNRLGYQVSTASSGAVANRKVQQARAAGKPIEVIFLDLGLPSEPGVAELLRSVRKSDNGIKAVITGGQPSAPEMVQYRDFGFQSRLSKPYDPAEFSRILLELLPEKSEA